MIGENETVQGMKDKSMENTLSVSWLIAAWTWYRSIPEAMEEVDRLWDEIIQGRE